VRSLGEFITTPSLGSHGETHTAFPRGSGRGSTPPNQPQRVAGEESRNDFNFDPTVALAVTRQPIDLQYSLN